MHTDEASNRPSTRDLSRRVSFQQPAAPSLGLGPPMAHKLHGGGAGGGLGARVRFEKFGGRVKEEGSTEQKKNPCRDTATKWTRFFFLTGHRNEVGAAGAWTAKEMPFHTPNHGVPRHTAGNRPTFRLGFCLPASIPRPFKIAQQASTNRNDPVQQRPPPQPFLHQR